MPLALPVMIAPMGSMYLLDPEGDVAMARAAGRMGTIHWLSTHDRLRRPRTWPRQRPGR